jgi:hypothetical protein
VCHPRLWPDEAPNEERDSGDENDDRDEVARDDVGELLDRRPASLRLGYHGHDTREQRLSAYLLSAHHQGASAVHRRAHDLVAQLFLHRDGLASHHRLINRARTLKHHAIHWDSLTRAHTQAVADLHGVERHVFLGSVVANAPGRLGRHAQELPDGRARLAPGAALQHLAKQDEGDDDARGLEVDGNLARLITEARGEEARQQRPDDAIPVGDEHAEPDQREHVETAILQREDRANVERPGGPNADRRRQHELDEHPGAHGEEPRDRLTRQEVTHGAEHER